MTINYHNEMLFSEIYLEDITRQVESADFLASLNVLREYRDFADTSSLKAWKDSYVNEVLSALGFLVKPKSDPLNQLFQMGNSEVDKPLSLCYVVMPEDDLDNTTIGQNWAEKIIRALRENNLNWGLLTNGKLWRIYHLDEPTPYETYLEIDLDTIIKEKAKAAYQIFYKFLKAENFVIKEDGRCEFDRFKKESQDKIDYIEKELANALKQREEGGKGVLSDLCMGYVEELRRRNEGDMDDEALRSKIYHSAMLYMFRLLFLFYADARRLLSDENHALLEKVDSLSRNLHNGNAGSSDTVSLWELLETIFVDIDQTYNGGLFSPQESEFTRFLSDTIIANAYLANVIFNLSTYREKNGQEKPISYRDMSVRHLGTLYEGLLEHKLFVAKEDTEVKVSKGKIQFIPSSQGGKLSIGHYIKEGEVYFAGDLYERKSSGSYFTPEDVVDYIVSNTVGEKLAGFKKSFLGKERTNCNAYSQAVDESEQKELAELIEENAIFFINKEVLQLSVLDPAMGSGHFLVNSTNIIANFITDLLNEIGIISNSTSGTKYWRRWVVESCIYGVDINPLAVELAKLSLWLLSMAKGQPLSFLKHHLKKGNSLVGARLDDIGNYPFSLNKKTVHQLSLFDTDPNFKSAVESAISKSQLIASRSSTIRHDVEEKKGWLEEMDQILADYKTICNIHTDIYFSKNKISENQYLKLVSNRDFSTAKELDKNDTYFHWELEFPMVLLNKNGFDCVVGNPPYVDVTENEYISSSYSTSSGRNLYNYFVEKGLRLLDESKGSLGFLIPISIISSERMKSTREFITGYHGKTTFINIDSSANPGVLFSGLKLRLSITFISLNSSDSKMRIFSSDFTKFFNAERNTFIPLIKTVEVPSDLILDSIIPKIGSPIEISILQKMLKVQNRISDYASNEKNGNSLFYKAGGYNYMLAFSSSPFFEVNGVISPNSMTINYQLVKSIPVSTLICLFPTSLFYWFWTVYSDCFHFSQRDLIRFPINLEKYYLEFSKFLDEYVSLIEKDLERNAELVTYNKANGPTRYYLYRARFSKSLFDDVDDCLGKYYGFTNQELLFIKSYDLQFRTDERE